MVRKTLESAAQIIGSHDKEIMDKMIAYKAWKKKRFINLLKIEEINLFQNFMKSKDSLRISP
jgi:hypothetical protein